MTASLATSQMPDIEAIRRIQLIAEADTGRVDFLPLRGLPRGRDALDQVSLADLLRNAFVYPPHSIYRDVKLATSGFDGDQDLHAAPEFHFEYHPSAAPVRPAPGAVDSGLLLKLYHRLLCDAVARASATMATPWLMQSGGKDSTSMAIAVAEARPDTVCLTYLGGREEDEVGSARFVARQLGLRHEVLVCDPGRAYDRYLTMAPDMPLLTADFATLSYADLVTQVSSNGGDGVIDALGSDKYFGMPVNFRQRLKGLLARRMHLPQRITESDLVGRNFRLSYALGTLQMDGFERVFPGSRFTDKEVDALFGYPVSARSRRRLELFRRDIEIARSMEARRRLATTIFEAACFCKGIFTSSAAGLQIAYPYCDQRLSRWIFSEVPDRLLIGRGGVNKVLVRRHIAQHFDRLPYVRKKGCFRFDLCGLASLRFDQVYAFAEQASELLPGAAPWLLAHRRRMSNKYFASKFYLLAVTLPWLLTRMQPPVGANHEH